MKNKKRRNGTIGIIGYGIVGQALAHGFSHSDSLKNTYSISFYDKYKESEPLKAVVEKSQFVFICLPTPMKSDESGIDLSIIEDMVKEITPFTNNTDKIIVIKSTVVPGTTDRLAKEYPKSNFCFSPEFLTEANYLDDFKNSDRFIFGSKSNKISKQAATLFETRFPKAKIFHTDSTSAELVKYMANTYLATKVIFANQMFDLCESLKVDYKKVKSMAIADKRIHDSHLDVTLHRGFGGKCFPKDIVSLIGFGKDIGVDLHLLESVWNLNKKIRKTRDWEEIPFAVSKTKVLH
jgi:nucleotide sugar dehydrogenase